MGTWNSGPFDNHTAAELLAALRDGTFDFEAFKKSCTDDYIDVDEAETYIALGALTKLRADELPQGIAPERLSGIYTPQSRAWLRKKINQALQPEVSGAVALWEETGELEQWVRTARAAQP
ncbi:DUF4259 domain-containing protein [uncultured Corynebacterium sp.]|uniref:DUF4259 domain-containing protein n=1 Tax=uncultured Corynebacterium sp. TaxID=159447 RepID=UPI0025F07ED9|nr:DUF4259 domain-containing protein [uncultured Corynebacterium sp.]